MNKEQAKVFLKYKDNPKAFINSEWNGFDVFKKTMGKIEPFTFQKNFIDFIHSNQFTISAKTRQMHLSTLTCAYVAWYILFNEDKTACLVSNNSDSAKRLLSNVRNIVFDFIKKYSLDDEFYYQTRENNAKILSLFNGSKVKSVTDSPDAERGEQIHLLFIDEAAFIKNLDGIWMGVGMALHATKGKCIILSSPNGFDSFYKMWAQASNGDNSFMAKKFKWDIHPHYSLGKYLDKDSGKYSSPWRDSMTELLGHDEFKLNCEIDCEFSAHPEKSKNKILSIRVDNELYNKINKCMLKRRDILNISDYIRCLIEKDYNES